MEKNGVRLSTQTKSLCWRSFGATTSCNVRTEGSCLYPFSYSYAKYNINLLLQFQPTWQCSLRESYKGLTDHRFWKSQAIVTLTQLYVLSPHIFHVIFITLVSPLCLLIFPGYYLTLSSSFLREQSYMESVVTFLQDVVPQVSFLYQQTTKLILRTQIREKGSWD